MSAINLYASISKHLNESSNIENNEADRFRISYLYPDRIYWKNQDRTIEIVTNLKILEGGMEVTEYRTPDELKEYIIEE